jgi:hypothetical protein
MVELRDAQFGEYTGGPAEAKQRHLGETDPGALSRRTPPDHQGQMFDPASIPLQEPHQQTPAQFARDPRTWWHGRFTAAQSRLGGAGLREGFHAGTEGAARKRLSDNQGRRTQKEGVAGRLFPLRITGSVAGPEQMQPDVNVHYRLGRQPRAMHQIGMPKLPIPGGGYLYENQVESPGSISVGVPKRKGFLSTYREMVTGAEKRGENVHPNISWAARHMGEHTGETLGVRGPYGESRQLGLHEQFEAGPSRLKAADQLHPARTPIHRTSYTTLGGKQQHVWRYAEGARPPDALVGRQWELGGLT